MKPVISAIIGKKEVNQKNSACHGGLSGVDLLYSNLYNEAS
jgi:hypothetical protein